MKVVLICPVYPPEILPSAVMAAQLARRLASRGDDVEVLTAFPSLPEGKVFPGYRRSPWKTSNEDGIRVVRCFSFVIGSERGFFWRVLSHLSFALTAGLRSAFPRRPDLVVVEAFPVISSPIILFSAKLRRIPCVNYVKDLYPESAEDAGLIRPGGILSRAALRLDRLTCRVADLNLVLSEAFRRVLIETRGVPEAKCEVIHDWIDGSRLKPVSRTNAWRRENDIPESRFVAMFAGTMGLASGADILPATAAELRSRGADRILILCIGEGVLKSRMVREAEERDLDNIRFLPFQPEDRLAEVLSTADTFLLTMARNHSGSSVPSKLITYMAMGGPILCSVDARSPIASHVTAAECGIVVESGDHAAMADALIEMSTESELWRSKGPNGRRYFEKHFDMPAAMKRFEDRVIDRITASRGPIEIATRPTREHGIAPAPVIKQKTDGAEAFRGSRETDCPICGPVSSSLFQMENGFRIVRCDGCGLLYVNPRLSREELAEHFREEYIADDERAETNFTSFREASLRRECLRLRELLPRGGRLVDVGAASGAFLTCFDGYEEWNVEGIEPSRYAAQYAREKFGLTVHQGFLRDRRYHAASFDVVTCLDTFSYIPDPNGELAEIRRILKPGGFLAVEIPGLRFRLLKNTGIAARILYGAPSRLDPDLHLYYYSGETLSRLVGKHGFSLTASSPEQSPLYGSWAFRLLTESWYRLSAGTYVLTNGRVNVVPKEFLVYRKDVP
jgi:colanic acid biosynthesis glycosyl transferase WcaI